MWLSVLKNVYKHLWFFSASQGAIAGIISAVGATVVASVASFIAYQKKKLCFKQSGKSSKSVLFPTVFKRGIFVFICGL